MMYEQIKKAVIDLSLGKFIVLRDAMERENEADLVVSPLHLTEEKVQFMLEHGAGGLFCVPMTTERIEYLGLTPLQKYPVGCDGCNFANPVDPKDGGSGVSVEDRLKAVRHLTTGDGCMNITSPYSKLKSPGHTFPLIGHEQGIFGRKGHTEGSLELMKMAGLQLAQEGYAAVINELMYKGKPMRGDNLDRFVQFHDFTLISIEDVVAYATCLVSEDRDEAESVINVHGY